GVSRRTPELAVDLAVVQLDGHDLGASPCRDRLVREGASGTARVVAAARADEEHRAGPSGEAVQRRAARPAAAIVAEDSVVEACVPAFHDGDDIQGGAVERDRAEPRSGALARGDAGIGGE